MTREVLHDKLVNIEKNNYGLKLWSVIILLISAIGTTASVVTVFHKYDDNLVKKDDYNKWVKVIQTIDRKQERARLMDSTYWDEQTKTNKDIQDKLDRMQTKLSERSEYKPQPNIYPGYTGVTQRVINGRRVFEPSN